MNLFDSQAAVKDRVAALKSLIATLKQDDRPRLLMLRCATCLKPLKYHTFENDFVCAEHGFVDAVTETGDVWEGHGYQGPPTVIRSITDPAAMSYGYMAALAAYRSQ